MKIAITGGTGFVGKHLAIKHIERGDSVRVLTRKVVKSPDLPEEVEFYSGDLSGKQESLTPFVNNSDILYHCAAELKNPQLMYATQIEGTKKLLNAASGRIGRWVQLSSVGVYGPHRTGVIDERTPINPKGEYENTKARSDEIVIEAGLKNKIEYSILRPSNIFGPTMTNQSLYQLIKMIDHHLFFFIGRSGASANYIHIDNVVEALQKCGVKNAAANRIFNISDYMVLEEFVTTIANLLNKKEPGFRMPESIIRFASKLFSVFYTFPLTPERVDALTIRSVYLIDRIKNELRYAPVISMKRGLKDMVKNHKGTSVN